MLATFYKNETWLFSKDIIKARDHFFREAKNGQAFSQILVGVFLLQSKNFDSDGLFIKKHISELRDLDKKEIHDPSLKIRQYCKYPSAILDLKSSRLRAIDAFSEAKN